MPMSRVPAANRDLDRLLDAHLFVVCPNDSGSSFLAGALETCRAVWRLPREGQKTHGYAGPLPWLPHGPDGWIPGLLWAAEPRWIDLFSDPRNHDWPRTRKAWHFHAFAADERASVFVTKSPSHVLCVEQLDRHFHNARFLFMVRNPYAMCEGICRYYRKSFPPRYLGQFEERGKCLATAAATHAVHCLAWQRRNVEAWGSRGAFFTYERMCAEPDAVAEEIRALAPQLEDLNLRRRVKVKCYDEMLTDMNARHFALMEADDLAAFNRVFEAHEDALRHFGYELMA